ncbi:MAG: MerR family transcriptional regulator [Rubrobacter sp.]
MRERLRIGEIARLVGVTTKAVRHYERIGLLGDPERSEAGYRLYGADDLLRLHRIKKLQSLGLSLGRVRSVLGEAEGEISLRSILEKLRVEVEVEIGHLEERRERIEEMLSRESLEAVEASPSFELAMDLLGEHLSGVSEKVLEQEKWFWSSLDAFEWPEGYEEGNEKLFRYYASHPEEYRALVLVGERLAALMDVPEEDPEVERVAEDLLRYFEENPLPEEYLARPPWSEGPLGQTLIELMMSNMSPAQRRCMGLLIEQADRRGFEEGGSA